MKERKRAQVAVEYLILTAFILVSVAIIFAFSFINYNQNIRIAKANEALAKMANAVDDIYTRGEGNTRFEKVSFPEGMTDLSILHKCVGPGQGDLAFCGGSYDDVEFSAISMTVQLIGGESTVTRRTKAKIEEDLGEMSAMDGPLNRFSGSSYPLRVSWQNSVLKLEKV